MSDKETNKDQNLDELLRKLFLDKENLPDDSEEAAATVVMAEEYDSTMNAKKENELIDSLSQKPNKGFKLWYYLGGAFLLFVVILCIFMIRGGVDPATVTLPSFEKNESETQPFSGGSDTVKRATNNLFTKKPSHIYDTTFATYSATQPHTDSTTLTRNSPFLPDSVVLKKENRSTPLGKPETQKPASEPDFPILTAYEIERNTEQKSIILSYFVKLKKEMYAKISGGSVTYRGTTSEVKNFIIKTYEVTNFEYKTFLVDLLYKKRYADYKKAQVFSRLWEKYGIPDFGDNYFHEEDYNDYPVVNITVEGAQLFCKWLEEESAMYNNTKLDGTLMEVRLPTDVEWTYVARAGNESALYCNGKNTVFNDEGGKYANFRHMHPKTLQLIKENGIPIDTSKYMLGRVKYKVANLRELKDILANGYEDDYTTSVDEFTANKFGVFDMAGNVSELVKDSKTGKIRAIGGNWNSMAQFLQVEAPEEFAGAILACPFIGFRPVIIIKRISNDPLGE